MKVIFLDVDGVLNCTQTSEHFFGIIGIDNKKVEMLKEIVDATGAKLVLSSTWRKGWFDRDHEMMTPHVADFEYLEEKLAKQGLKLLSRTPKSHPVHPHRGKEIQKWLDKWGGEPVENYIILDDDVFDITDTTLHRGHVIETSWKRGLRHGAVKMAIQMLNKKGGKNG